MLDLTIREGQIWVVDDKRRMDPPRYVRIIETGPTNISIRTCDRDGNRAKGSHVTYAARSRFGKAGGYMFVREGIE
jgi:hypothetical protein